MLALELYLDLQASIEDGLGLEIVALVEGAGQVPLNERNAVYRGVARAFAFAGKTRAGLPLEIDSQVPLASGLGSRRSCGACYGPALAQSQSEFRRWIRWG